MKEVHMSRGNVPSSGCLFFLLLLTLPLAVVGAWAGAAPADKPVDLRAAPAGLSSLPAEAQASVSAALGRDQWTYHAKEQGEGWRLANPKHSLRADFTARGVEIQTGAVRFGLRLSGLGRGARVEEMIAGTPKAKANRVEYRRGTLTEWYVNGPLGLEQGFTLERPPARLSGEALTLSLRLTGEMSAVPDPKGDGVALKAREGATVLRYRGLVAWDATGRALPAWWQIGGDAIRLRVDDTRARYPLTIDPFFEQAKLTASDGAGSNFFGFSLAVSGDTVVVGAPGAFRFLNSRPGAAYVFVKPAGGWAGTITETAKLIASDAGLDDGFGVSAAVSGDTVVLGAFEDEIGGNEEQGSAYVFVKPPSGWAGLLTENAKLTASDGTRGHQFGVSVAAGSDTVVVGARFGGENIFQGSTYVFVKPPGGWAGPLTENAKLTASDGGEADSFGVSVAMDNDTAIVGAAGGVLFTGDLRPGAAYVFVKPPGGWAGPLTENAKLTASDGAAADDFGDSVAIDNDTMVVGARGDDIGGNRDQGSIYVFVKPPGGWVGLLTENAKLTATDGEQFDRFGNSVAVSGNTVMAGAMRGFLLFLRPPGSAYLFVKPSGDWAGALTESAKFTAEDGTALDQFGSSVAVVGDTVVVGASGDDIANNSEQGSAYVFTLSDPAEPASSQVACEGAGAKCKVPITCNLPQDLGTRCRNRIDLFAFVRGGSTRLSEDLAVKAPRRIKFAFGIANVPPGETKNVSLRLTSRGRKIARSGNRRLRGVIEIRNTPGDLIDTTPIRIRIRRK